MLFYIDRVFENCDALTSIEIPNGVVEIGQSAFAWSNLEIIILGSGIEVIGDAAFSENDNLTAIYYCGTESDWDGIEVTEGYISSSILYFYSEEQPAIAGNYWRYVDGVPTVWSVDE